MSREKAVWAIGVYFGPSGLTGVKIEAQWEAPAPTVNVTPEVIQATRGAVTPPEFEPMQWVKEMMVEGDVGPKKEPSDAVAG